MKYKCIIPITADLGPTILTCTEGLMESKEDNALWHYNQARAHDGNPPLDELPRGTQFEPLDAAPALPSAADLCPRGWKD